MLCDWVGRPLFSLQRHEFAIYSEYCNNHPHTVNEMNTLQQNEQYAFFFEVRAHMALNFVPSWPSYMYILHCVYCIL